jgi:hypothetical protein
VQIFAGAYKCLLPGIAAEGCDDDPLAGQQTAALSGKGWDYPISSLPDSVTLKAGNAAIYSIAVKALGGNFATPVSLACGALWAVEVAVGRFARKDRLI